MRKSSVSRSKPTGKKNSASKIAKSVDDSFMPYLAFAKAKLKERRVMPLTELEELVATNFAEGLNEDKVRGSSRTRWQNLVDWVKATLTKRGVIRYVFCGPIRCVAYLEPEQRPMVTLHDAYTLVQAAIAETTKALTNCKPPATEVGDWLHARDGGKVALIADAMAQEDSTATLEDLQNELESGLGSLQYLLDLGHADRTLGAPLPEGFDDDND